MKWYENKILKKLFLETKDWNAAWKDQRSNEFYLINNPEGYWLADTLIFKDDTGIYLFVEAFDKKASLGRIGVLTFNGKEFKDFRVVLEKDYHLSYPYVFMYNNQYYMIPESSANNTIELYQSIEFPYKWEKISELLHGRYVDTTLYQRNDGKFKAYAYDVRNKEMLSCILDMDNLKMVVENKYKDINNQLRDGGNIFKYEGKLCRAVQNNINFYGQSLAIIDCDTEKTIFNLYPEDINTNSNGRFRRLHTYSRIDQMEAIDLSDFKFEPFKIIRKMVKKI